MFFWGICFHARDLQPVLSNSWKPTPKVHLGKPPWVAVGNSDQLLGLLCRGHAGFQAATVEAAVMSPSCHRSCLGAIAIPTASKNARGRS